MSIPVITQALTAASSPLLLIQADGTIESANAAAASLVGLATPVDLVGRNMFEFTSDADRGRRHLDEVMAGTMEAALVRAPLTTPAGEDIAVAVWWRRLTTEEGVRGLIVLTPADEDTPHTPTTPSIGLLALITTDHDWRIVDISPDADQLIGDDGSPVGDGLLGLIHPLDVSDCVAALDRLSDEVRTVTLNARLRRRGQWSAFVVSFTRLCAHQPARLGCLLWPAIDTASQGASDRLSLLLEQREAGHLVAVVGHAINRFAAAHDLTGQELEIVARSVRGQGSHEIAEAMYLSDGTVRNMLSALYRKFGVRSQLALVAAILHE